MARRGGVRLSLRIGALALVGLYATTLLGSEADARSRRHYYRHVVHSYEPAYASIVVDANSGDVMQSTNPDSARHPASLTKVMTLYLLFEKLAAGKIKMTTPLEVSEHAASMAPSKLELKPGQEIAVEDAIKAIVTKSANDVAVVVAEAIGGSETEFAQMMTEKAHALGMKHTSYHNASGLPDDRQITTARDQSILARAIQERFPQYYHYFSTRVFVWHGEAMRNHNHLLGNVPGVDGMKTGYIHDSGFNIITSVRRNGRHIIAVVFGGSTARARDARVEALIDNNINVASVKHTAPAIVEADSKIKVASAAPVAAPAAPAPAAPKLASASTQIVPEPGSTAPIKPHLVKTIAVAPGATSVASLSPLPSDNRKLAPTPALQKTASITTVKTVKRDEPAPAAKPEQATVSVSAKVASAGNSVPLPAPAAAKPRSGWMIQVGAFDDEGEAKQRLATAKTKAQDQLGQADPFTEKVEKGEKSMFRARFAGLERSQAEAACKHLKRSDIPCITIKN